MVRVKICGITNIEDAKVAVEAGANALGFVFAESPRKVEARTVSNIVSMLPPLVAAVGVFANQEVDEIRSVMESTCLHFAQMHGDISNPGLGRAEYPFGIIRALRVRRDMDIEDLKGDCWLEIAEAVLLDTHVEGLMGGTGQTFDWDLAVRAKSLGKPVILAGGLTPANVREAVSKVCPYAVDVSSGVEAVPGRKDHDKVREFVNNATR